MSLPKLFERIFWHNNTTPAVNETNLNAMSKGLSDVDDRLISLGGLIMETVPEIQQDMEILGPAVESIDDNVARAEAAAESAEQYAEEIAPPIEVVEDYADIITVEDAINKPVKDLKVKVDAVQDLHGYTKPWVGGAGKNKGNFSTLSVNVNANNTYADALGTIILTATTSLKLSFEQSVAIGSVERNTLTLKPSGGGSELYPSNVTTPSLNKGYHEGIIENVPAGTYQIRGWFQKPNINMTVNNFMVRDALITDNTYEPYENICPITGHSEANLKRFSHQLWDEDWEVGSIGADGTKVPTSAGRIRSKNPILVMPSTTYYKSPNIDGYALYDINGTFTRYLSGGSGSNQLTTRANEYYIMFATISNYGASYNNDISLNYPSTATAYEPYKGEVYTIDLDGTRYGGVLDVDAGTLTLTHKYIDLPTSWAENASTNTKWLVQAGLNDALSVENTDTQIRVMCNLFEAVSAKNGVDNQAVYTISLIRNQRAYLIVPKSDFASINDIGTFIGNNNGQFVYPLATPQTITLTAEEVTLLLGYNTLFADTGDIALTYDASGVLRIANAKLDIDTFKSVVAASSDFADFKTKVAAL